MSNQAQEPNVITKIARKYTDDQIGLIKATFNEHTLMAIRKYLLQSELNDDEYGIVESLSDKPEAIDFLRNALIPRINADAPIDNLHDVFGGVDLNANVEYVSYDMEARQLSIDYFEELINLLVLKELKSDYKIKLTDLTYNRNNTPEKNYINIRARNIQIIQHIEFQIKQIMYFYGLEEETEEEQKKREKQDSVE